MEHVRMINWITGTEMSVPIDLVERYKEAGHKLAEDTGEKKPEPRKKAPAKRAR